MSSHFSEWPPTESQIRRYSLVGEQEILETDEPEHRLLQAGGLQHCPREEETQQREVIRWFRLSRVCNHHHHHVSYVYQQ